MESSKQSQTNQPKTDVQTTSSGFEGFGGDFVAPIEDSDMLLRSGQDDYTPKQIMQLQRVLGNQATLQLVRKQKPQGRDFTKLKMVQRDEKGGLPPPPPENDNESRGLPPPPDYDEDNKSDDPPPLFSESTGLSLNNSQQTSSIKSLHHLINMPDKFAKEVLNKYTAHLQLNPNDKTFTQNWKDFEVDAFAEGWVEIPANEQKGHQYAVSQLVLEDQRVETAVSAKQFEKSDQNIGKKLEKAEGALNVGMITSAGFSVGKGVEIALKLKDGIGELLKTTFNAFEKTLNMIIGFVWLPLLIGYEVVKAFHYHKRRRDGFKTRMDALEGKNDKTKEESKLYNVAKYGYKKTRRAFATSMAKIALRVVRMISLIITVLTGGTTAAVTGAIAAISAIVESSETLYRKVKGLIKIGLGTRGKNRQKNAEELVKLAKNGNVDAAQTILDVNPFDEFTMKNLRKLANKLPTSITGDGINPVTNSRDLLQGLSKPESAQDLIMLLQNRPENGGWTAEHETMLERAIANVMVSQ